MLQTSKFFDRRDLRQRDGANSATQLNKRHRFVHAYLAVTLCSAGCGSSGSRATPTDGSATPESTPDASSPNDVDASFPEPSTTFDAFAGDVVGERLVLDPAAVVGRVVNAATGRGLARRLVSIGGRTTTTDERGAFVMTSVASAYDIAVTDADGSSISLYRGLTRRDPILAHRSSLVGDVVPFSASVGGAVSGGAKYPLGLGQIVAIYFFSDDANGDYFIGGGFPAAPAGPEYGPIRLTWSGAPSIGGALVALGRFAGVDAGLSWWTARRQLSLANGDAAVEQLDLAPVTEARLSGTVSIADGAPIGAKQIAYRLPFTNAVIGLITDEDPSLAFDYALPDLSDLGGSYCAGASEATAFAVTMRCGLALGTGNVAVTVLAPPSFSSPQDATTVTLDAPFAWTAFEQGIYQLSLRSPDVGAPSIDVFLPERTIAWRDLKASGVPFPNATYGCSVGGLAPYLSMDDAAGPQGLALTAPDEARRSFSRAITVTTSP